MILGFPLVFQPNTVPRLSLISPPQDGRMGVCSSNVCFLCTIGDHDLMTFDLVMNP